METGNLSRDFYRGLIQIPDISKGLLKAWYYFDSHFPDSPTYHLQLKLLHHISKRQTYLLTIKA